MAPETAQRLSPWSRFSVLAGLISIALGLAVLAAWTFGLAGFLWLLPNTAAMQPVTAILFTLAGAGLVLASRASAASVPLALLAAIILVVSLATLFQYAASVDLGIDRLLFGQAIQNQLVPQPHPGRMAEPTAVAFGLVAVCLLTARAARSGTTLAHVACVSALTFIVAAELLGFLFGLDPLTGVFGIFNVAISTALGLAVLSAGLLALRPDVGLVRLILGDSVGAAAARRVLPLVVVVPVGVALLADRGSSAAYYPPEFQLVIMTTITLGLLVALTMWAASRLNTLDSIRRTEEALRTAERRLEAVLNNASVAIFTMDERHHCSYMNPAAEKMTGYTFAETLGRPLHDVVHHTRPDGSHFPLEECPIDRAFPEKKQEQGEETFVHRDGTFYRVSFTASPCSTTRRKRSGRSSKRATSSSKRRSRSSSAGPSAWMRSASFREGSPTTSTTFWRSSSATSKS